MKYSFLTEQVLFMPKTEVAICLQRVLLEASTNSSTWLHGSLVLRLDTTILIYFLTSFACLCV